MKNQLNIIVTGLLLAGLATSATAKSTHEEKNSPKNRNVVADILEALGEEHFPEKMKIREIGSVKTETTYYHVYCGTLKKGGYRVIVFNNKPEYLGYYYIEQYEPSGYEDGAVLIDVGGNEEKIRLEDKGPVDNTRIDGVGTKFIKAPEKKVKAFEKPKEEGAEGALKPEFREWTITLGSQKLKVRAIYVSQTFGKVKLRAEASGKENEFAISSISKVDREYIKQFK